MRFGFGEGRGRKHYGTGRRDRKNGKENGATRQRMGRQDREERVLKKTERERHRT